MPLRETRTRKVLTEELEQTIAEALAETDLSLKAIGDKFMVSPSTVSRINGDWTMVDDKLTRTHRDGKLIEASK